jgi:DNA-binding MarR family transcriptional regulator
MTAATLRQDVSALIGSIRQLFQLLKAAGSALHADIGVTASMRAVLESISRQGPNTVPELARQRPVSRQHIQRIVDQLLERELVRLEGNPSHKRSPRVALTPRGEAVFKAMSEREKTVLSRVARGLSAAEAHIALRALGKLKSGLMPLVRRAPQREEEQ